jgi:hypothetical protein
VKRKDLDELLPRLQSGDAFERLEAEGRLRDLAERDFGVRWDDPPEARTAALARLRAWLEARQRAGMPRRRGAGAVGPIPGDLAQLQGMTPKEVEEHLQKVLSDAQAVAGVTLGRPRCEDCRRRPSTVSVVEVRGRRARALVRLCEACAVKRGGTGGG